MKSGEEMAEGSLATIAAATEDSACATLLGNYAADPLSNQHSCGMLRSQVPSLGRPITVYYINVR